MEIKKVNIFFPFFIFGYIFLNVAVALIESLLISAGIIKGITSAVLFIQNELVIVILLFGFCLITGVGIKDLRFKMLSIKDIILSLLVGYLIIPMSLFLTNITSLFVDNAAAKTVSEVNAYPYIVQIILIAVMPAFVEEFTFRGLFYGTYRKSGKYFKAMLLSAVLFGLFHLNFDQFVYATFMGVLFARLTEATGSILSSILAHFAFNTFSVTVNYLYGMSKEAASAALNEESQEVVATPIISLIFLFVLGLLLLSIALLIIQKLEKEHGIDISSRVNNLEENVTYAANSTNNEVVVDNQLTNEEALTEVVTVKNDRLITVPLVLGMVVCLAYMIFTVVS